MANLSNINGKFVVEQTTGYVGVGTTDPNYPIEVLNASAEIALNASGGSIYRLRSDSTDYFRINKNGVGDRLVIAGNGNVGIGIDPVYKLDVRGERFRLNPDTSGLVLTEMQNGTGSFYFGIDNTTGSAFGGANSARTIYSQGAYPMAFWTNNAERMRIDSSGIVKINTTAVNARFRVDEGRTSEWIAGFKHTGTSPYGVFIDTSANAGVYALGVYTNTGTGLFVENDGKVGIGTTSPSSTLTLGNATGNVAELRVLRSNSVSGTYGFINTIGGTAQIGGSGDTRIIASSGRLLFNSNNTDQISLEANGEYRLKLGSTTTGYEASMSNSNTAYQIFGSRFGGTGKYVAIWSDGANENTRFYPTKTIFYQSVGIGTDNPSSGKLVVEGDPYVITNSGKALGGIDLRTNAGVSSGDYGAAISFGANGSGRAAISSVQGSADADRQGLVFFTHGSGVGSADSAEAMRISHDGNVGIGTTSPGSYDGESDDLVVFNSTTPGITIATDDTTSRGALRFADGTTGNERYRGGLEYDHNTDVMLFRTLGAQVMTLYDGGRLHPYGGVFLGSSNNDQLLSYYKEGTWTPTLEFGGNAVGITYGGVPGTYQRGGHYTRIGRVVTFSFRIILTSKGTSVGDATITGLPFVAAGGAGNYGSAMYSFANNFVVPERATITIDTSSSIIRLRFTNSPNGNYGNVTNSDFNNNSDIILTGTYQAAP